MQGLTAELLDFLAAVLAGAVTACAYACIRRLRRVIPHTMTAVNVEDGLFWIGAALYLFSGIYRTADGEIRWYFAAGALLGAAVFSALWRRLRRAIRRVFGKNGKNRKKSGKTIEIGSEKR